MATHAQRRRRRARALDHDDPRDPRFGRHAARRGPRTQSLSRRPAGLSRPARHVLGPAGDRAFDQRRDRQHEDRVRHHDDVRRPQERPLRADRRHERLVHLVAVRPRRLADPRLSRPAGGAGAESLLYRTRGFPREPRRDRAAARRRGGRAPGGRRRLGRATQERSGDGEPRRGHPGAGGAYAPGAAADSRLGRGAGRTAGGHPPPAAPPGRRARKADSDQRSRAMALGRGRRIESVNYWPGFVDALVDDAAGHHLPALGVHALAILPVARGDGQGHRARASSIARSRN